MGAIGSDIEMSDDTGRGKKHGRPWHFYAPDLPRFLHQNCVETD